MTSNFCLQTKYYGTEESWQDIFTFIVDVMEAAIKTWHETGKVDARVNFLLDKQKTDTDKYAPIVNIDKVRASWLSCFICNFLLAAF